MPEEATETPAVEEDTSQTTAAPEEGTPAPDSQEESPPADIDYKQRYESLVPEYTRGQQLLAAARGEHGPEAQINALRQLGVEAEMEQEQEPEEEDEWVDPEDRISKMEQRLSEREEREEQAHFQQMETEFIESTLDQIEQQEGVKLSDEEAELVTTNALANRLDNGEPNLKGAFDALKGIKSAARDEYLASKKAPRAPVGTAGEEKIDLSDPDARQKYMTEVMDAEGSE